MTQAARKNSDFNLEHLTTSQLEKHISSCIQMGSDIAIFGRRGTGKTQISKQQIASTQVQVNDTYMHCKEVYINLSVLERVDLGGYPDVMSAQKERRFVDFLLPEFYKDMLEGNTPVVALLDEVDKADPSLWAPLLEFVQFKSVNGRKLNNLRSVIMTGNLIAEGGNRPSLPLLDRAEKYLVQPDASSWLHWAGKTNKIHPSIVAYINDNTDELFGEVDPENRYADTSPRGWERASNILFTGERFGWSVDLLNQKVSGCIGKSTGIKYSNYYEHYQQLLPMIKSIFEGRYDGHTYDKLEPSKQIITCMILCTRLANELDALDKSEVEKGNLPKCVAHIGEFFDKNVDSENILISVRSQIQIERLIDYSLDDHPTWKPFLERISKQVDGA